MAMLWMLAYSDGGPSLLDIAVTADLAFALMDAAARDLTAGGLLGPRLTRPPAGRRLMSGGRDTGRSRRREGRPELAARALRA